jgi:hypothetical protein
MVEKGYKRSKPIEYNGTLWYQCAMCGEWSNHIEHMTNQPKLFENIWDEENVGQMMGYGTYCVLTINNVTKPFVCALCVMWEGGLDKKYEKGTKSNKTTQQLSTLVEMRQYDIEMVIYAMEFHIKCKNV